MDILSKILESKRQEIKQLKDRYGDLRVQKKNSLFIKSLEDNKHFNIIAEIKKGSPSKGLFAPDLDIVNQTRAYERMGATCLSVLTDSDHFFGSFEDLRQVRQTSSLPILCKDFIIDPIQIRLAAHMGADCILLIKRILSQEDFCLLYDTATSLGLDVLVEVDSLEDFQSIEDHPFKLCGINHRNLKDFSIDLNRSKTLAPYIRSHNKMVIGESGIHSRQDLLALRQAGLSGALIGESLIKQVGLLDDFKLLKKPLEVKLCGIKDVKTALIVDKLRVDYMGLVFCQSPRQCTMQVARAIRQEVRSSKLVGVFKDMSPQLISQYYRDLDLDYVQIHGPIDMSQLQIKADKIIHAQVYSQLSPSPCRRILIDNTQPGSGQTFPLDGASLDPNKSYMLAGGLSLSNIKERSQSGLYRGVDISSGIESRGQKDPDKIEAIVKYIGGL